MDVEVDFDTKIIDPSFNDCTYSTFKSKIFTVTILVEFPVNIIPPFSPALIYVAFKLVIFIYSSNESLATKPPYFVTAILLSIAFSRLIELIPVL